MDILSKLPVELAHQILSSLDIKDLVACQSVSRPWYWITVDQSVWKKAFLERERPFAIPPANYSPLSSDSIYGRAADTSTESSSASSLPLDTTIALLDLDGEPDDADTVEEATEPTAPRERDWKQECRARVISDRNWAKGHIQSLFTLRVHRGAIVRLRIKGDKLLSADIFGQVAVWNTGTWDCERVIDAAVGPIQLLDFSAAAMVATVISKSGVCRIWDLNAKSMMHSSSAFDVACMTMDDKYLVLGKRDGQIELVDFISGQPVRSTEPMTTETLQEIYIQNDTLVVATGHFIRILSIETLDVLLSCPLPIPSTTHTFCSVFHIRSLILLTEEHILHIQWEPLYKSPNKLFPIDTRLELPPDLSKAPFIHRTKIPPIATITSVAIGGNHPHVLTTNADRPSLHETIRVCPTTLAPPRLIPAKGQDAHANGENGDVSAATESASSGSGPITVDDVGIVLTSQDESIATYLDTCGLKPSFMDVEEDLVIVGTSKGDIVVLGMMAVES
ncbi:hypothetical protein EC968_003395 [Mortierella alpina]|nr:hypothetical protein EC968_003395 [Mortierella alpina]